MISPLALLVPVVLSLVLLVSGVAKLRSPESSRSAFVSLRLPRWLSRSSAPALLPWAEIILAAGLMVLPGVWGVAASSLTAALMVAYLVVIMRALGFDEPVTCGCFGELGLGEVTRRTAFRNVILVLLGAAAVTSSLADPRSPVQRWLDADPNDYGWLFITIVTVVLAWLIVAGEPSGATASNPQETAILPEDELEYLRTPTPYATLRLPDGSATTLRELSRQQAQLVLFVNSSCGSCLRVLELVPAWKERLAPVVGVRALFAASSPKALGSVDTSVQAVLEDALFDDGGALARLLEISGTPAAVLFGADQMLAGGPVAGSGAVIQFVEDVLAELESVEAAEA